MLTCKIKNVWLTLLLVFFISGISSANAMRKEVQDVVLNNFDEYYANELIRAGNPNEEHVSFLRGHLFPNGSDWYRRGILDLCQKVKNRAVTAKAILVEKQVVGVIWETSAQCDIFVHPKFTKEISGIARKAIKLFIKAKESFKEVKVGISVYNIPSLKSLIHVLESEGIYALALNRKINISDLKHIVEITTQMKSKEIKSAEDYIEKIHPEKDVADFIIQCFSIKSVQLKVGFIDLD
jgi:hypothetical protein